VENPSGVVSARDFRVKSLVHSVLDKGVGGSGFMVRDSGAPKVKVCGFRGMDNLRNVVSIKRQLANRAL
jgi:hypothetical protein